MKEKMRSTMKKGAVAIQQATKKPPSLQDILKKRNSAGSGENKNEGGEETASKPTLAGAAAAALAKTKNKARESMVQLQQSAYKDDVNSDSSSKNAVVDDKPAQNPRVALMNSLRRKTPTPSSEGNEPASVSAVSADPRAALLGAIRSKSKGATSGASNDDEEEIEFVDGADSTVDSSSGVDEDNDSGAPSPPLDPRAAMLAAIKKKKNPSRAAAGASKKDGAKQTSNADPDPRSALLSAIKTKKKKAGGDEKDTNLSELACIANRNLRSRNKGILEPQDDGGDASNSAGRVDDDVCSNHVDRGDKINRGLVLTKSEANLVFDSVGEGGDDSVDVDINANHVEDNKQVGLSDSIADRMDQTDTLLVSITRTICTDILPLYWIFSSRLMYVFFSTAQYVAGGIR
jgi:hypothetical protein